MARLTAVLTVFFGSSACGEKQLRPTPLPELVGASAAPADALAAERPLLIAGERLTWEVIWRGITVGRAQLAVATAPIASGANATVAVRSRFRTRGVARKISPIDHDLTTEVHLIASRARDHRDRVHTLHSALAALRAWVEPGARPGYLTVRHDGRLYRVEIAGPLADQLSDETTRRDALRVECSAARASHPGPPPLPPPLLVSLWFSTDRARVPLRIDVDDEGTRAHALLIERDVLAKP